MTPPRTGSRSLEKVMAKHGFERIGGRHDAVTRNQFGHEWTIRCTVRNHWSALVSWYGFAQVQEARTHCNVAFAEWLEMQVFTGRASCAKFMAMEPAPNATMWHRWTLYADEILRYEDLGAYLLAAYHDATWDRMLRVREEHSLPPYREAYANAQRLQVAKRFATEIADHGYEF